MKSCKILQLFNFSTFQLGMLGWAFLLFACTKAGEGGKSSITASVKHDTKIIPFAQVYIKYDSEEFPGYDMAVYEDNDLSDVNGIATFDTLYKGDYYLYAIGYDSVANENVFGSVYVKLRSKEDRLVDIPVFTQ